MAKFSEFESANNSAVKSINSVEKSVLKLIDTTKLLQKQLKTQATSQATLTEKTNNTKKAVKQVDDIEKQRLKLLSDLKKANTDRIQTNAELQVQLQKQRKTNKDLAREKLGLVSVYEKESKRLNDLRKRYKEVALTQGASSKEAKKLAAQVKGLDKSLKSVDASSGQFQRSVGNYPGAIGRAQTSIQGLNTSFKALLANPIVATIAAIVGVFVGLTKALKRSEEGQNALNKISSVLSGTLNVFLDIATKLAENLIKAFEDPQQAVRDLWEVIKTNLVNRVKGVAELFIGLKDVSVNSFKLIGASIKGIFKDNQEAVDEAKKNITNAAVDIGKAFIKTTSGFDPDKVIEGFKGIVKEISEEADILKKLADRQAALDKVIRGNLIFEAQQRDKIFKLREVAAKKEEFTAEERLAALDEAIKLENELLDTNLSIAEEKANIKEVQNALGASTKQDLDEEAQLRANVFNLEAQAAKKRRTIESERVTALREVQKEEDLFWQEFLSDAAAVESVIESQTEAELNAVKESLKAQTEARIKAGEEEIKLQQKIEAKKEELRKATLQAGIDIASNTFGAFIDNNLAKFQEGQETQLAIEKNRLESGAITEGEFQKRSDNIKLKSRQEQAKAEKKKALFDIAIATAVAAVKALPVLPLVALTIALGAVQAAVVAAKPIPKFKKGKVNIKGKSHSEGGINAEIEGGESVINKESTANSTNLLEAINKGLISDRDLIPSANSVFSGADTKELAKENKGDIIGLNALTEEVKGLRADNKNKPTHINNITKEGISYMIKKGSITQKYDETYWG